MGSSKLFLVGSDFGHFQGGPFLDQFFTFFSKRGATDWLQPATCMCARALPPTGCTRVSVLSHQDVVFGSNSTTLCVWLGQLDIGLKKVHPKMDPFGVVPRGTPFGVHLLPTTRQMTPRTTMYTWRIDWPLIMCTRGGVPNEYGMVPGSAPHVLWR